MTLKTPLGIMSLIILANSKILKEVSEDGFIIVQHPEAKTGANFKAPMRKG